MPEKDHDAQIQPSHPDIIDNYPTENVDRQPMSPKVLDYLVGIELNAVDDKSDDWRRLGRCNDGFGSMLPLFFSESIDDINRAKAFCQGCMVKDVCLLKAIERREPAGVWGGESISNGRIVTKRRIGRPKSLQ